MAPSSAERKIRAGMPALRLLQAYIPLSLAGWLTKQDAKRVRLAAGVARAAVLAGRVPCEWLIPQNSPADQVLLYLHGGGFVFGLSSQHLRMGAYLARQAGIRTLMVDYRVGPAHPFPAALDDCVTAYRWLLKQGIAARNIAVAGDSAGGNLTITTLMKLRDSGDPLAAAAACLSPVANLAGSGGPAKKFNDPLLSPRAMKRYNAAYVGHNDSHDPLISPVFGDWHGLPPLLIHAGEDERLRDDAVRIEGLARAAGVDVRPETYPRMFHVWQLYPALPEASQSLDDIAQFLREGIQKSKPVNAAGSR